MAAEFTPEELALYILNLTVKDPDTLPKVEIARENHYHLNHQVVALITARVVVAMVAVVIIAVVDVQTENVMTEIITAIVISNVRHLRTNVISKQR